MPDTRLHRSPSADRTIWTVADLEALPDDGNRYETLHCRLSTARIRDHIATNAGRYDVLTCAGGFGVRRRYETIAATALNAPATTNNHQSTLV